MKKIDTIIIIISLDLDTRVSLGVYVSRGRQQQLLELDLSVPQNKFDHCTLKFIM
jgi:hypothetical protein